MSTIPPQRLTRFAAEYLKHAALNFGQALQGLRYLHSHPDIDAEAEPGTARHVLLSLALRTRRVANDLCFALLPPQTHHSRAELEPLHGEPLARWFQYGYCAWRFTGSGEGRTPSGEPDRRWDPRCRGGGSPACA